MNGKQDFPSAEILEWDVSRLGLSTRGYNSLWRSGHTTIGGVYKLNPRELYAVRGIGGKSLDELIRAMHNYGFHDWADAVDKYKPRCPKRRAY